MTKFPSLLFGPLCISVQ